MRSRAWDAHAAETVDNVEQSFQDEALAPAPRCRGRDSSDREVLPHVVYVLGCDFYDWNCSLDYMLLWLLEMSKTRLWVFIRGW